MIAEENNEDQKIRNLGRDLLIWDCEKKMSDVIIPRDFYLWNQLDIKNAQTFTLDKRHFYSISYNSLHRARGNIIYYNMRLFKDLHNIDPPLPKETKVTKK